MGGCGGRGRLSTSESDNPWQNNNKKSLISVALSQSRMRLGQGVADTPPELGFIPRLTPFPLLRVLGEQRRVNRCC